MTDILPTADHKVAIDTLTDIECVVIASIDRHSIESSLSIECWLQVDRGVDRQYRLTLDRECQ